MQNVDQIKALAESLLNAITNQSPVTNIKKLAVANQPTKKQQARQMIEYYWNKKYPGQ